MPCLLLWLCAVPQPQGSECGLTFHPKRSVPTFLFDRHKFNSKMSNFTLKIRRGAGVFLRRFEVLGSSQWNYRKKNYGVNDIYAN